MAGGDQPLKSKQKAEANDEKAKNGRDATVDPEPNFAHLIVALGSEKRLKWTFIFLWCNMPDPNPRKTRRLSSNRITQPANGARDLARRIWYVGSSVPLVRSRLA